MQILQLRMVAPILMFVALSGFGCDDNGSARLVSNGVGPSSFSPGLFVSRGAMVQPASIEVQRVRDAFCPNHPPFLAPFSVVFEGDGRSDIFLSDVQMQFVDSVGSRAGTMTFGAPELAARFGSTTLPAFGTRVFPFSFPFGCAGLPSGTLTVTVLDGDPRGHRRRTVAHIPVR